MLVRLAGGEQHDKEGEQQRDEVGVGDQPTLVIHLHMQLLVGHAIVSSSAAGSSSNRNVRSFISSMRGFMPSKMDTTPSMIISFPICSSRYRIFSFPAIGRQTRFARPTP